MNRKHSAFILIFLLIFTGLSVQARENLQPLDSFFVRSVESFYTRATENSSNIWPGMQLGPVCLFRQNGPAILYNHPNPPESFKKINSRLYMGSQQELQLFGATQKDINGTLTAIVDYGSDYYYDPGQTFAELFHELHHVFQRNSIKSIRFDDISAMLTYPENFENDAIKLYEQQVLLKMCFAENKIEFRKLLNIFFSCRSRRRQVIGDYMSYEKSVEDLEGPAFYCEYKFFKKFSKCSNSIKRNYLHKHFWGVLTSPYFGRDNLRKRHLASGMAMCFLLDKHCGKWKSTFYQAKTHLYDFFVSRLKPEAVTLRPFAKYRAMSRLHTQRKIQEHRIALKKFNSRGGTKVTLIFNAAPRVKGFDPMHAQAVTSHSILHKTLLHLAGEDSSLFIENQYAVTEIRDKVWFVDKLILFVPENSIQIKNSRILINSRGININWRGRVIENRAGKMVIQCE